MAKKSVSVKVDGSVVGTIQQGYGPLSSYWSVSWLQPDGRLIGVGGSPARDRALAMLREYHARKTAPRVDWLVRTVNGSWCIVQAATEAEAWEIARRHLVKWADAELRPTVARRADAEDYAEAKAAKPVGRLAFGVIAPKTEPRTHSNVVHTNTGRPK